MCCSLTLREPVHCPNLFPLSVLIQATWSRNSQQREGN